MGRELMGIILISDKALAHLHNDEFLVIFIIKTSIKIANVMEGADWCGGRVHRTYNCNAMCERMWVINHRAQQKSN